MSVASRQESARDEAYRVVRRFSERIGDEYPQNTLARALTITEQYAKCREEDLGITTSSGHVPAGVESEPSKSAIELLDQEIARTAQAQGELREKMSKDQALPSGETLDFSGVRGAIDTWIERYEKKKEDEYASAKGYFQRFCGTMDAYSNLLSFIPDDDKYLKPFCGALTIIVQASINKGKIAEGFASALAEVGVEMDYSKDLLAALKSRRSVASIEKLLSIVAQFCTQIFRFLQPYLRWCQSYWKRFKSSIDKTYYEKHIQGPLAEIRKFSNYLTREANVQRVKVELHTEDMAETGLGLSRKTLLQVGELLDVTKDYARRRNENETNRFENLRESEAQSLFEQFAAFIFAGRSGQQMLMSAPGETFDERRMGAFEPVNLGSQAQLVNEAVKETKSQATKETYAFEEVEPHSRMLNMVQNGYLNAEVPTTQRTPKCVYSPLQDWLSASGSRTVWLYGPANARMPSEISSTSAYVVSMMESMKVPLIAHRCRPQESETVALISMIYSLILQLVWLLPEKFSSDRRFHGSRFAVLDGSINSLESALILFEDLLAQAPRILVCVVDGIQMIEDGRENARGTGMFLDLFLEILKESKDVKLLKLLLTTDGFCHRLDHRLDPDEKVDAMRAAEGLPGGGNKSRVSLAILTAE